MKLYQLRARLRSISSYLLFAATIAMIGGSAFAELTNIPVFSWRGGGGAYEADPMAACAFDAALYSGPAGAYCGNSTYPATAHHVAPYPGYEANRLQCWTIKLSFPNATPGWCSTLILYHTCDGITTDPVGNDGVATRCPLPPHSSWVDGSIQCDEGYDQDPGGANVCLPVIVDVAPAPTPPLSCPK